ncbi:MAG TPA: cupin domain-containing protein [Alphaproteobacteria bacterium]|nr:cupin domain-containing protein [Alphaproteobacteria bacterium]
MAAKKQKFSASHAKDAVYKSGGLRACFEYRDLGISKATGGRAMAHLIRAKKGDHGGFGWHKHSLEFQMYYVLRGWVKFNYEGVGEVVSRAGSCVLQPPGIRHAELDHSDDLELLEVTLPAKFKTSEVAAPRPARKKTPAKRVGRARPAALRQAAE